MNLQELRERVVKQCGRTNLVGFTTDVDGIRVPDYSVDNGADEFINSAIETLSNEIKTQDNLEHFTATIDGDAAGIAVPGFLQASKRGVNLDGEPLDWVKQQDVRAINDIDTQHTGTPDCWFRITRKGAFLPVYMWDDGGDDRNFEIGVYPIPDGEYTLTVSAWTFVKLVENDDENWWSMYQSKSVIDLACAEINSAELNGDRRVLDATLERVKFNLLARDILEEEVHIGNEIG